MSNQTIQTSIAPAGTGYADVNGLHLYYETYGSGAPLVLLHGGMLTIDLNFVTLIPTLAQAHTVIGVELQGHGRTANIDRPITYPHLASDVVALLDHLGIDTAAVIGHSMGGGVALDDEERAGDPGELLVGPAREVGVHAAERHEERVELLGVR